MNKENTKRKFDSNLDIPPLSSNNTVKDLHSDDVILGMLKNGNERAMDILYNKYYTFLCITAKRVVSNAFVAEDVVQDVYAKLWVKRMQLSDEVFFLPYLKRSVINASINALKKKKKDLVPLEHADKHIKTDHDKLVLQELQDKIDEVINEMPEKCRAVFVLSRFEELKYKEIAEQLGISIKTVENHMSKALKIIRVGLADYVKS
ncbi:MAG: RNA polymerase sigma-70 factor [Flavobacteriales bacterium]|nr:RNA polymerase sigma-70 factor [Flavobacteriales bacterium]